MKYDFKAELKRVKDYYKNDKLQKRFSALILGETGAGKSRILRTCPRPIHVDSFDPGGTKVYKDLIDSNDIIADTSFENENPYEPTVFTEWKRAIDTRLSVGYFNHFATYCLDSATTWADAAMNDQLKSVNAAGQAPKWNRDYTPQKTIMINYIKKLMNLPCNFILTGHLNMIEEVIGQTKEGSDIKKVKYRFFTTGKGMVTIPLQFDEIYVLFSEEGSQGLVRKMLIEAQGTYIARSRLKGEGRLNNVEKPDIREILKKAGMDWQDKPRLEVQFV